MMYERPRGKRKGSRGCWIRDSRNEVYLKKHRFPISQIRLNSEGKLRII